MVSRRGKQLTIPQQSYLGLNAYRLRTSFYNAYRYVYLLATEGVRKQKIDKSETLQIFVRGLKCVLKRSSLSGTESVMNVLKALFEVDNLRT